MALSHQTAGMDTRTVAAIVQFLFRERKRATDRSTAH
jgi:hypothetical protein